MNLLEFAEKRISLVVVEELYEFVCGFALDDEVVLLVDEGEEVDVPLIIAGLVLLHCN